MLSLILLLLEFSGVALIVRYAYRRWRIADIKQKEANLDTLKQREQEVERIKQQMKSDPKTMRQKIDDFYSDLGDV